MKILILSKSDILGGAARAAYRLHQSLLIEGIDSQMLVQNKNSDDFKVVTKDKKRTKYLNMLRPIIDSLPTRFYKNRKDALFSISWLSFDGIVDRINELNPDIVHIHWIAGGMMRIEEISQIKVPLVLSLHDMWAFTGGCHYDQGCGLYENNCGKCKILSSEKEPKPDEDAKMFNEILNSTFEPSVDRKKVKFLENIADSVNRYFNNRKSSLPKKYRKIINDNYQKNRKILYEYLE